jgi:hypothetical protein
MIAASSTSAAAPSAPSDPAPRPRAFPARPAPIRFELRADVAVLEMGDRRLLVADGGKRLFELPGWIGALWPAIGAASDASALARILARGLHGSEAEAEAAAFALLASWSQAGLARLEADHAEPPRAVIGLTFAGCDFTLRFDDAATAATVRPLFAHVARPGPERGTIIATQRHGDFALVTHPGGKALLVRTDEVAPTIKGLILEAMLADRRFPLAFHAACIARDGCAILLVGSSGAGKTLFSLAAARHGFGYAADDVVLVDARARVTGVPFAPAIKASGWALAEAIEGFGQLATHRRLDGVPVRYPPPPAFIGESLPIGATILLDRTPDGPARLDRIDPVETFVALLTEASAPGTRIATAQSRTLAAAIAGAPAYRLHYSDLAAAMAALDGGLHVHAA